MTKKKILKFVEVDKESYVDEEIIKEINEHVVKYMPIGEDDDHDEKDDEYSGWDSIFPTQQHHERVFVGLVAHEEKGIAFLEGIIFLSVSEE